jgi:hypothetical protein
MLMKGYMRKGRRSRTNRPQQEEYNLSAAAIASIRDPRLHQQQQPQ